MRDEIRKLAMQRDFEALRSVAEREARAMSALLPMTYELEGLRRWRAIEAIGVTAAVVAERDPEFVRRIVRRLFWSLCDESGAVGWSAPEAIGEIVAARPDLFAEYAPMVVSLFEELEEEYFHPGILWAVGRIAERAPALVREAYDPAVAFLKDPRPRVRGMAAWCLGRLCRPEDVPALQALFDDGGPVQIYEDGALQDTTVGQLARQAAR